MSLYSVLDDSAIGFVKYSIEFQFINFFETLDLIFKLIFNILKLKNNF